MKNTPEGSSRLARQVSWALHPFVVGPLSIVLVLHLDGYSLRSAIGWPLLSTLLIILPFTIFLAYKVATKQLTDADVSSREQRPRMLLFAGGFVVLGLLVLARLGAPSVMIRLIMGTLAILVVFTVITKLLAKASLHVGAMAGATVAVAFYSWPWALAWAGATALVAWSRITLKRHTIAEIILGAAVASIVFFFAMFTQN